MFEITENTTKDVFIGEIVNEIKEIPPVYLQTLYAIIHSFKENIIVLKPSNPIETNFDWDELLNEVHKNRQQNNLLINKRLNQLFAD